MTKKFKLPKHKLCGCHKPEIYYYQYFAASEMNLVSLFIFTIFYILTFMIFIAITMELHGKGSFEFYLTPCSSHPKVVPLDEYWILRKKYEYLNNIFSIPNEIKYISDYHKTYIWSALELETVKKELLLQNQIYRECATNNFANDMLLNPGFNLDNFAVYYAFFILCLRQIFLRKNLPPLCRSQYFSAIKQFLITDFIMILIAIGAVKLFWFIEGEYDIVKHFNLKRFSVNYFFAL